ncbi:hypothetical protein ACWPKS_15665 [Coraliomargarita sp. W4R72]
MIKTKIKMMKGASNAARFDKLLQRGVSACGRPEVNKISPG